MHTKAVGDYGMAMLVAECVKRGYTISIPFGDNARYDAVVERSPGKLERVQVKTVTPVDGRLKVPTKSMQYVAGVDGNNRSCMKKYTAQELDVIVAVDFITGELYWLESLIWDGRAEITLRLDTPDIQVPTSRYAANFVMW